MGVVETYTEASIRFLPIKPRNVYIVADIVFIRCWYPITVPRYYNPVTSLLMSSDDKNGWQGMRTVAQIRKDRGLEIPLNRDSLYKVRRTLSCLVNALMLALSQPALLVRFLN